MLNFKIQPNRIQRFPTFNLHYFSRKSRCHAHEPARQSSISSRERSNLILSGKVFQSREIAFLEHFSGMPVREENWCLGISDLKDMPLGVKVIFPKLNPRGILKLPRRKTSSRWVAVNVNTDRDVHFNIRISPCVLQSSFSPHFVPVSRSPAGFSDIEVHRRCKFLKSKADRRGQFWGIHGLKVHGRATVGCGFAR